MAPSLSRIFFSKIIICDSTLSYLLINTVIVPKMAQASPSSLYIYPSPSVLRPCLREFHLRHSEDGADSHIFILSLSFSHYLLSLSYLFLVRDHTRYEVRIWNRSNTFSYVISPSKFQLNLQYSKSCIYIINMNGKIVRSVFFICNFTFDSNYY